jgi:hypothetical protein
MASMAERAPKRYKSSAVAQPSFQFHLQYPGNSTTFTLPETNVRHRKVSALRIEHGTSLSLIARGTMVLNDEFNEIDPG